MQIKKDIEIFFNYSLKFIFIIKIKILFFNFSVIIHTITVILVFPKSLIAPKNSKFYTNQF